MNTAAIELAFSDARVSPRLDTLLDSVDSAPLKLDGIRGTFSLRHLDRTLFLSNCPLLWMSETWLRLATVPLLYGVQVHGGIPDDYFDMSAALENDRVIVRARHGDDLELSVYQEPLAFVALVGRFHFEVLRALKAEFPSLRRFPYALGQIADASTLAEFL
jgi:hypothetical protein